jgi:hypothetical protein
VLNIYDKLESIYKYDMTNNKHHQNQTKIKVKTSDQSTTTITDTNCEDKQGSKGRVKVW